MWHWHCLLFSLLYIGRKNGENDKNYDTLDLPKRTEPSKGRASSGKQHIVLRTLSVSSENNPARVWN